MYSVDKLKDLVEDTDYNITQVNGQRIYALRKKCQHEPPKGCELFVGKLPRDLFEDKLVPIFRQVAPIFDLRLMVDFIGRNRGYCFVRYFTREAAELAIKQLNNYEVREGCYIGVYRSLNNTRLFVGGLPTDKTKIEILDALNSRIDDIKDIIMYPAYDNSHNRGYAFLEFENHRAAAIARRRVPPGSLMLWGAVIKIDWADPLPEPQPSIMSKVTTLYVRNIPISVTNDAFRKLILNTVSNRNLITRVHKILDYAFIHCVNRMAAVDCREQIQNIVIEGNRFEISWARPESYSKKYGKATVPSHFCLSLPAKTRWLVKKKQLNGNCSNTPKSDKSSNYDNDSNSAFDLSLFSFDADNALREQQQKEHIRNHTNNFWDCRDETSLATNYNDQNFGFFG